MYSQYKFDENTHTRENIILIRPKAQVGSETKRTDDQLTTMADDDETQAAAAHTFIPYIASTSSPEKMFGV